MNKKYRVWVMLGWFSTKKHNIVTAKSPEEAKIQFVKGAPDDLVKKLTGFGFWLKVQEINE